MTKFSKDDRMFKSHFVAQVWPGSNIATFIVKYNPTDGVETIVIWFVFWLDRVATNFFVDQLL